MADWKHMFHRINFSIWFLQFKTKTSLQFYCIKWYLELLRYYLTVILEMSWNFAFRWLRPRTSIELLRLRTSIETWSAGKSELKTDLFAGHNCIVYAIFGVWSSRITKWQQGRHSVICIGRKINFKFSNR